MIVVVVEPDAVTVSPLLLGGEHLGVEELVGGDPLEPLNLPVVTGCVGPGPLMTRDLPSDRPGERVRAVVRPVVTDQAGDPGDPVRVKERERPMEEPDRRRCCLVLERFGVGQAGEPVDRRVEVGVADPPALPPASTLVRGRCRDRGPSSRRRRGSSRPSSRPRGPCARDSGQ